jgi:hypothetical protein
MEWISNVIVLENLVLIENASSRRIKRMKDLKLHKS